MTSPVLSNPSNYQSASAADQWVNQCATLYGLGEPELVQLCQILLNFLIASANCITSGVCDQKTTLTAQYYTFSVAFYECVKCPVEASYLNKHCNCPQNQTLVNNTCQCAPTFGRDSINANQCICPANFYSNGTACVPSGEAPPSQSCPMFETLQNGTCKMEPLFAYLHKRPELPPLHLYIRLSVAYYECLKCPLEANLIDNKQCVCPENQVLFNGTCQCAPSFVRDSNSVFVPPISIVMELLVFLHSHQVKPRQHRVDQHQTNLHLVNHLPAHLHQPNPVRSSKPCKMESATVHLASQETQTPSAAFVHLATN